jgi:WD40 repeat protein
LNVLTDQNAGQVSGLAEWLEAPVTDLAWTPDGQHLAVAGPGTISLYEIQNREKVRALYPRAADIVDITFRPDGGWLVSASRLGSEQAGYGSNLELWQGPYWRPLGILYGTQRGVSSMTFSGDGKTLLTAYASPEIEYQSSLEFWDTSTWEITTTITTGTVLNMAVSPDGLLLATSPDRYAISIRDLRENEVLHNLLTSFTGAVNSLVFSPNGGLLATGHYDGTIRLWNVSTGELLVTMDQEGMGVVESLAFNPQGNLLASGHSYQDNLVRLWSVASGELLRSLEGHQHAVDHLLFSPDGQVLVSGSYDGTLRLWGIRQ